MKRQILKELLVSAAAILLFQGCTSKVEIPVNHAGVVKLANNQVNGEVLKPGQHLLSFGSRVIIYDLSASELNLEFDFLFADTTAGDLTVAMEFEPIADSLSAFYKKYDSMDVTPIIEQATGIVTRDLLFKYRRSELTRVEFERRIVGEIKTNHAIVNYVKILKVEIIELIY